jgi:hypothetical protein
MIQSSQKVAEIPHDVILAFSSRVFIPDTLSTQYIRADITSTITMQEIDAMIKKIETESFSRARSKAKLQYGIDHDDIRLISSTITSIRIDGKVISNPIGFSGKNIRLSILNVFAPASEFNMVRSVIASLGKDTISLIPTPLVFAKLLEHTDYSDENTIILDIGYAHTTILITSHGEMVSFETFHLGSAELIEMIRRGYPHLTAIQIEDMLSSDEGMGMFATEIESFYRYLVDMISGFIEREARDVALANVFCHGGIFIHPPLFDLFMTTFQSAYGHDLRQRRFSEILPSSIAWEDMLITYGLALMASELLLVKKDPLVRILRYVLYNYE